MAGWEGDLGGPEWPVIGREVGLGLKFFGEILFFFGMVAEGVLSG